jgi:hypothetical protein
MSSPKICRQASIPNINTICNRIFLIVTRGLKELAKRRRKIFGDVVIKHLNTSQLHGKSGWWYEIDHYLPMHTPAPFYSCFKFMLNDDISFFLLYFLDAGPSFQSQHLFYRCYQQSPNFLTFKESKNRFQGINSLSLM